MKNNSILLTLFIEAALLLFSAFQQDSPIIIREPIWVVNADDKLHEEAFQILEAKCNECHRQQQPFWVFEPWNMDKRKPGIRKMVFEQNAMSKGKEIHLTSREYQQLEAWLFN